MTQFSVQTNDFLNTNKSIYEVVMLADKYGNVAGGTGGTSVDAFGRLRVSQPFTLFDSSHRYRDNNLWSTSNTANSTVVFSANEGLINLTVDSTANTEVIRETTKVFSYQPGKSLLIFTTFVFSQPKTNLRQRVGYYGANNGMYLEQTDSTICFVERSSVTGSLVETRVEQSDWNVDKMDGTGPSGMTLNLTKAQILWMDIEWLGLGSVRMGFIIDGQFVLCHTFHHANIVTTTYITTASLPLRMEIKNTGVTSGSSTLKQICSSVISEGGYELNGLQQAIGNTIGSPTDLTNTGTYYNLIALRLKSTHLDAIAIMSALSLLGITNNAIYNWQVRASATTTGGTWTSAGTDSSVEYKIGGTISGGRILASGFTTSTTQSSVPVDVLKEALFKFQLERNGLSGTPFELSLCCASDIAGADVYAYMDWEEVSR